MTPYKTLATRLYAALMVAFAVAALVGGLTFWHWSLNGVPAAVTSTLQITEVTERMLRGLGGFAIFSGAIAVLNAVFAFLIAKQYRWPAVLSTLGWSVLLIPLVRDTHSISVALVLTVLIGLTVAMMWPRSAA